MQVMYREEEGGRAGKERTDYGAWGVDACCREVQGKHPPWMIWVGVRPSGHHQDLDLSYSAL